MTWVYPDYYKAFRCTAGACRHSCCIGWEIDIDEETLRRYDRAAGALGQRLRENIERGELPHFVLGEEERCPFLNEENLCEIILALGEEALCEICREHPRFHNQYPGRTESGLGLCCEAAGSLILGRKEPVKLLMDGKAEEEDLLLSLRDSVLETLQERTRPLEDRVEMMLDMCSAALPERTVGQWAQILLELERLEESWTGRLKRLKSAALCEGLWTDRFQLEQEQLLVYFVYRYLGQARDERDLAARAAFAVLAQRILCAMGELLLRERGEVAFADLVELARQFSAEVEYSEENMEQLLDILGRPWPEGAWLDTGMIAEERSAEEITAY